MCKKPNWTEPEPTFTGFEPHITKPEQNRTLTIKKPEPKQTQNLRFPISNCNLPLACKNPSDFRLFLLCHIDLPPRLLVYSINFTWCSNLQRKESLPFKQWTRLLLRNSLKHLYARDRNGRNFKPKKYLYINSLSTLFCQKRRQYYDAYISRV